MRATVVSVIRCAQKDFCRQEGTEGSRSKVHLEFVRQDALTLVGCPKEADAIGFSLHIPLETTWRAM
jgi:hypothetical protein